MMEVKTVAEKIRIRVKGEDGYKIVSLRIREVTLDRIDSIAEKTNRSRNELINIIIEQSIDNIIIEHRNNTH